MFDHAHIVINAVRRFLTECGEWSVPIAVSTPFINVISRKSIILPTWLALQIDSTLVVLFLLTCVLVKWKPFSARCATPFCFIDQKRGAVATIEFSRLVLVVLL